MSEIDSANVGADKHPDFAVVWSFFSKFGKQLELENVSIEDVSKWITTKCSESSHTVDVMVKLMRKTGMRVDKQRWQKFLLKATGKQDPQLAMAISANGFDGLSYIKKLKTFKLLCEMQFDDNIKFKTQINNENPEEQRLKPVGKNEDGCLYWYQQDEDLNIRIYMEDQDDDDDETGWKVACRTKDEIEELIKQLNNESTGEKPDNSDNEDDDIVETKFQKFLKSQCNDYDENVKDVPHDETESNNNLCNEVERNLKSEDTTPHEHVSGFKQSDLPAESASDPLNYIVTEMNPSSAVITKLTEPSIEADQVDESVMAIEKENLSCSQSDKSRVLSNEDKPVVLDFKYHLSDDFDKTKTKTKTEPVLDDHDHNKSTIETTMPGSNTSNVSIECKTEVIKLDNIANETASEKSEGPDIDVKSEHIVNGNDTENKLTDVSSIGKVQVSIKQDTTFAVEPPKIADVVHENNTVLEVGLQRRLDAEPALAETSEKETDKDKQPSENNQDGTPENTMNAKCSPSHDSSECTPIPGTENSGNFETEENRQGNRDGDSHKDQSAKETTTPKKKKRRRRAPVSRRRSRTSKQHVRSKPSTPKQQTKPKLSRIELLQKEAESIIQKEQEEKEAKNSAYRTRSGRRVKTTKPDQNESDVWQSIPEVTAAKNEDINDKDFHYTEGKSRSTIKSDVEVTPKKPRRSRKNDLPCEKCRLFSHPTTILLCDECNKGYHMACLTPPLMAVPEDDWFCPKCCKEKLIANLKEIFEDLETKIKLNERKLRQTERNKVMKEYTGISTTNIIVTKPRPHKPAKRKKSYSSNSEDEFEDSDSLSGPSSPELKSMRSCRTKKVTYDFSSFDKTIRDAIGEVEEPDSSDEKPISGKDIRTIVAAQKGKEAAKNFTLQDAAARRKNRHLTNLNCSEDEVVESGSNYSVSSSEGEASEEEFMGSEGLESDESFSIGVRRSRRKKTRIEMKPIKRSKRLRRKRIQEEYASDISESSTDYEDDVPKKKKRRAKGDKSSEDEYQPPNVKPKNVFDDNEEDDEEEEKKEEPKRKTRVLHSSSEDETNEKCENTEITETAAPEQEDEVSAAPKPDEKVSASQKQEEVVSSDDWSSLSSNAEDSFEDEVSTEEAVQK